MKTLLMAVGMAVALLAVAGVMLGSTAEAKKNRINVVRCPTEADGFTCIGTNGRDRLLRTDSFDSMNGKGGSDIYEGRGGNDSLIDASTTGSDTYVFKGTDNFGEDTVQDCGGNSDSVNVSSTSFKLFDDNITVQRPNTYGVAWAGPQTGCEKPALRARLSSPTTTAARAQWRTLTLPTHHDQGRVEVVGRQVHVATIPDTRRIAAVASSRIHRQLPL
jgi:hypothetical protein